MIHRILLSAAVLAVAFLPIEKSYAQRAANTHNYAIVIHGGAGRITSDADFQSRREAILDNALTTGQNILASGGTSLDAVESVIHILEDAAEFNAGRGAVFNAAGGHELDASIMDGSNRACGAVGGVRTIRHPITLARRVMTDTRHVLLANDGAEVFADQLGKDVIERVPNEWFSTDRQKANLKKAQASVQLPTEYRIGTVGCVALDHKGNIAAGTSTGGLTNKKYGRVGDSPIVGAGTFADNTTCGVSCTGVGEDFIRNSVAFHVSARMEYLGESVEEAVHAVLHDKKYAISGGIIAISSTGDVTMQFNTKGMSRATANSKGHREVHVAD